MSAKLPARNIDLRTETSGNADDTAIERIMDAVDFLRAEMRRGGMVELADILDDAFVESLRIYIARQYERHSHVANCAGGTS